MITGWRAAGALSLIALCIGLTVSAFGGPWWLAGILAFVWGFFCPWRILARPPSTNAVDPSVAHPGTPTTRDEHVSPSSYDESPF